MDAPYTTRNLLVQTRDKVHQNTTWIWWCHEGKPWTKGEKFIGSGWYEFMEIYEKYVWICGGKILQQRTIWHPSPKKKKLGLAHALQSTLLWSSCNELFCLINIFKIFLQKPVSVSRIIVCRMILAAANYSTLSCFTCASIHSNLPPVLRPWRCQPHSRALPPVNPRDTPSVIYQCTNPRMHCCVNRYLLISNVLALNSSDWIAFGLSQQFFSFSAFKPSNFSTLNCLALLDGTFTGISEDTYMVSPRFSGLLLLLSPP